MTVHVICSVPQGSVLGPRLFIMYSADLANKALEHDIKFHGYADKTQLCVYCRPEEIAATTPKLECCITDMDNWMSANRLKLNVDKTELLWAGTRYNMSMLNDSSPSLQLNNVTVKASQHRASTRARSPSFFESEAGQTHFQCQRDLLLSSSSTQTCRLLQCNPRRGSEDNNRQATTSVKHCCTSRSSATPKSLIRDYDDYHH